MSIAQDARSALREIRKDFRFYAFAALIIGLGIGANTAVFSVMSPLLLRPLPFEDPEELVWVALSEAEGNMSLVTSRASNLRDFRELNQSFVGLTGYFAFFEYESYNLVGEGEPERLVGAGVAQDFLDVLGVLPLLGRNFVYEEGVWDGRPAAILTHGFWTRRFAADPGVVGRSITLNDVPTEVVGVLPPSFDFSSTFSPGSRVDFLRPFPISDETDNWGNTLSIIGRLRPGATLESAQADLDIIEATLGYRTFDVFSEPGFVRRLILGPLVGEVIGVRGHEPVGIFRQNSFRPLSQQCTDLVAIAGAAFRCGTAGGYKYGRHSK